MADYSININVNDREADRKLRDISRQANEASKPVNIKINVPNLNQTAEGFKKLGEAIKFTYKYGQYLPVVGDYIQAIQIGSNAARVSVEKLGQGLGLIARYSNPINGISDSFRVAGKTADGVVSTTARIGYTLFGVTQSVNVLRDAYKGFFDETIGREVRLRETLLRTATTLAGTNDVISKGVKIDDPVKQLQALEGPINDSIERIRTKSLEIAGVTSEAVIQTFTLVAQNIGQFGGTLRDAENLATKFAGALGTLGLSDPYYARQEVGSILRGTIDQNSVLAKTLGISNEEIARAKNEAGGLVAYLSDRLRVFEAGQKQASLGFSGITSNLKELQEELSRTFGAPFLDPLLARITAFYEPLSKNFEQLKQVAGAAGQLVSSTLFSTLAIASDTPAGQAFNTENVAKGAKALEDAFAKAAVYIQNKLAELAPLIQRLLTSAQNSIAMLVKSLGQIAVTLAQIKVDRLEILIRSFAVLAKVVEGVVAVYAYYLDAVNDILNTPLGRYLNDLTAQWQALERIGVLPFARLVFFGKGLLTLFQQLIKGVQAVGAAIASAAQNALNALAGSISRVGSLASTTANLLAQLFITSLRRVAAAISALAVQARVFFTELATNIQKSFPQYAALTNAVLGVAGGFRALSVAAANADKTIVRLGAEAKVALGQIEAAANKAAVATRNVGTTLGTTVTNGAAAAGRGLLTLAGGIARSIASLALWQVAITVVFDLLRRFTEWMEQRGNNERYQLAVKSLTDGLNAQAIAAARAGRELDGATAAIYRNARASLEARNTKNLERYLELQDEIIRRQRNLTRLGTDIPTGRKPTVTREDVLARDPKLAAELKQLQDERKRIENLLNAPERARKSQEDLQLRQRENKQQIEELARFERDQRKALDDQLFQNRMAAARKELEIFRASGELRIQQIELANAKLIRGTNTNARDALTALNEYITSKKKGELDIEARRREAQLAAAELDRALLETRWNLERQIAELKKKVSQYELEVLDKRLKTEQEIASVRNGSISRSTQGGGNGQFTSGAIGGGGVVTNRNDPDGEQTGSDIALPGGNGGAIQNPFASLRITKTGQQGYGSGTKGRGFGNYLTGVTRINGQDYEVLMGHLGSFNVKAGDVVPGGGVLGTQGITGRATGPHVSTHVNALNGGNAAAVLSAIENVWTKGGAPIQTVGMGKAGAKPSASPSAGSGPVMLNIDTGALEGSINRLKQLENQLRAIQDAATKLNTADKWDKFLETLYDPNALQSTNEALEKAKLGFKAVQETTGVLYDPEKVRVFNDALVEQYLQTEKTKALKQQLAKVEGISEEDRKKAAKAIEEADTKQKKQIQDRMVLRLQEQEIISQTAKLASLKQDTRNVGLNTGRELISGRYDLAASDTTDPLKRRLIQAQRDIALKRYDLSEGGTKDISGLADEMNRFAEATIKAAKELAALDKEARQYKVREQINQWNLELVDTQGQIVSLSNSFKGEFAGALAAAVTGAAQGTASVQDAFLTMFQNIGQAFLQLATEMIAKALVLQALGIFFPGPKKSFSFGDIASGFGGGSGFDLTSSFTGSFKFASGGRPPLNQPSLVGELGPELFVPDTSGTILTADATAALLNGNRSALNAINFPGAENQSVGENPTNVTERRAVIDQAMMSNRSAINNSSYSTSSYTYNSPFTENSVTLSDVRSAAMERQMATALTSPSSVNVNYSVERINSVDYVTAEEFRQGISQAADLGARQGQQRTLDALRQRPSVRRSLGIAQ